jgi:hypothetical protein
MPAAKISYDNSEHQNRYMVLTPCNDTEAGWRSGDVEQSKWNSRGWTMQERSLSTRLVHFCRNKLYFECRSCHKSEEGEPEKLESRTLFKPWPRVMTPPSQVAEARVLIEDLYERWIKATTEYSLRNLTHSSDKLRAIQSLATEMGSSISTLSRPFNLGRQVQEYIPFAGMWKEDLHRQLLWTVERGTRVRPPRDQRNVPTWSWASLDARVSFARGKRPRALPNLPDLKIKQESPDPVKLKLENKGIPFEIISFGPSYQSSSPVKINNYIEIRTLIRKLSKVVYTTDDRDNLDREAWPYNFLIEDATTGSTAIFAQGSLDLDNTDNLMWDTKPLIYAHITNEQSPSGLVLQQKANAAGVVSGKPPVWVRVGFATVFQLTEKPFVEPLFASENPVSIIIE